VKHCWAERQLNHYAKIYRNPLLEQRQVQATGSDKQLVTRLARLGTAHNRLGRRGTACKKRSARPSFFSPAMAGQMKNKNHPPVHGLVSNQ